MEKKCIALISLDVNDFRENVKIYTDLPETKRSIRAIYETDVEKYYCIINPVQLCSYTFDSVLFTPNAIFNKELVKIIEIIRPTIVKPKQKDNTLSPKLITWSGLDIALIEKAYNKIAPLVAREMCDGKTRDKIRQMMIDELPLYDIKCNEENNPPDVINSGHIFVKVSITKNNNYSYVDVIF